VDYRVGQFERFMADVERMDGGLRAAMAETESRVNADFARYAEGEEAKRSAFSRSWTPAPTRSRPASARSRASSTS
jgi:hypothetical protein